MKRIPFVLTICFLANIICAQRPDDIPSDPYGQSARDSLFPDQVEVAEITNVDLTYTLMAAPGQIKMETRDSLDQTFRLYDPADEADVYYQNLGNLGSPARAGVFRPTFHKGLHSGINQYNIYQVTPDSLRFYNPEIPLTSIYASQGASQDDGMINARFGRRFAKGIDASVNYFRINQAGEYQQSRTKNTNVTFGLHQVSEKGNFESYYAYISNNIVQENSGGILDYGDLALPENDIRAAVSVHLSDAITNVRNRHFLMQHYFHVRSKADSTQHSKNLLDISYKLHYNPYSFKFYDEQLNDDALAYYGNYVNDDRGLRNFIAYRKLINEAGFKIFITPQNTISGSIEHRAISLNQEPLNDARNEVYLNGGIRTKWLEHFDLVGEGYLGLLDASANFSIEGRASISFDDYGSLSGNLLLYQRRPFLLEASLFINQMESYSNLNIGNVNINLIGIDYQNKQWKVAGSAHWWLVNNFIYFGADGLPNQINKAISIRQISLSKDLKLGPILLLNKVTLQNFNEESLRLPSLIIQESLSLNGRVFKKKLQYQIGVDLTMTNTHKGVGYFPLTGQFTLNDEKMIQSFPALDAFISLRIKSLKVFLKSENINAFFNNDVYDQIIGYPQFESYFRFGFSFQLFN